MDERLAAQFDWDRGLPSTINLCFYALILAREDREEIAIYPFEKEINAYLAKVLHLGFTRDFRPEVLAGDYLGLIERLNRPCPPWYRRGIASQLGDQLLFFSSQGIGLGATARHGLSRKTIGGVGRQAYAIASSNARPIQDAHTKELYACLAEDYRRHQDALELAGHILGFEPEITQLLSVNQPVVTLSDALDAISVFNREPTVEHWELLVDAVRRRTWTDPHFRYPLPPRPAT